MEILFNKHLGKYELFLPHEIASSLMLSSLNPIHISKLELERLAEKIKMMYQTQQEQTEAIIKRDSVNKKMCMIALLIGCY